MNRSSKKRQRESTTNDEEEEEIEKEYQVEAILDKRVRGSKTQYYLKWKGYPHSENTVGFQTYRTRERQSRFHLISTEEIF